MNYSDKKNRNLQLSLNSSIGHLEFTPDNKPVNPRTNHALFCVSVVCGLIINRPRPDSLMKNGSS